MTTIRLLLADDNAHMLDALQAVLALDADIEIVGVARCGREAVRLADELALDVMVLDRAMPDIDGISAMREIKQRHPELPILILTATADPEAVRTALSGGASGYVVKDTAFEELARAIHTLFEKKVYLSQRVGGRFLG